MVLARFSPFRQSLGGVIRYLLRDDFLTDNPGPLDGLTIPSEPGPGNTTYVDTENMITLLSGRAIFSGGKASPEMTDPSLYLEEIYARVIGRTAVFKINRGASGTGELGFNPSTSQRVHIGAYLQSTQLRAWAGEGFTVVTVGDIQADTEYHIAVVLRSFGSFVFIRGGLFAEWTLIWVDPEGGTTDLRIRVNSHHFVGLGVDMLGLIDLARYDPRFATDDGLATSVLVNPVTNATAQHEADCLIEWNLIFDGTLAQMAFRRLDASNGWYVSIHVDGSLNLYELVGGVSAWRAFGGVGAVTAGARRIVIVAVGNVYRVYLDRALSFTYTDPNSYHINNTGLRLISNGTDNARTSRIAAFPRRIYSSALDRAVR